MDIYALGLREVISILFKHMKVLAVIFVCVFTFIFCASFLFTEKYKAQTRLLVQSGREFELPTPTGDNPPAGVPTITKQEIINTEVELLGSRDLIEATIDEVGLDRIYPKIAKSDRTPEERLSAAARKFLKDFRVNPVTMSNVVTLSYWNPDRDIAIEALQKLSQVYQTRHAEIFGNKSAGILERQTGGYEKQLEDVTQKITNLKNSRHLSDITYEREQLIQDRSDVEAKLRDLKAQAIDAHRMLNFFGEHLKSTPELVLMNQNSADAVETAKTRLLDLENQLLQLRQRYGDANPSAAAQMADVQDQVAHIKAFIADPAINKQNAFGRNVAYDDGRLKLQDAEAVSPALDQKISFLTAEDSKILARLQTLDDGEAGLEVLTRDQGTLRELVHAYRDRYEAARSSGDLDKEHAISVSVVHTPEADVRPDKPNRLVFAAVGLAMAMFSTSLALLYFLLYRDSIITTESLERTLKVRVIGSVPDVDALALGRVAFAGD